MGTNGGPPLHLKVFVSSPGDVPKERAQALALLAALPGEPWTRGRVTIEPVMWDDPRARSPMDAGKTPQASVNLYKGRPSDCDLTLVILWGRIGSPPDLFRPDGSRFASGTVWEYEDALAAHKEVWLYRCKLKPKIDVDDPEGAAKKNQYLAVKQFFEDFRGADGVLKGGFWEYTSAKDFAALLHQHLEAYVSRLLAEQPERSPQPDTSPPYLIPEPTRDHDIIGRDVLLENLWRAVSRGENCSLVFLAGVGKTAVALELVSQRDRVLGVFEGVLWADLGKRPEVLQQLRRWAEALKVPAERMVNLASVDDWKKLLKATIGERHLLLVLDDVWQVKDAREFAGLGSKCVSIITTRLRKVAAELSRQEQVTEVEELDDTVGLQLLREIAPHAVDIDPDGAREMVTAVQGLPLALVLVGKYLKRESGDGDPDRIAAAFATLREAGERLKLRVNEEEEGGDERTLEEIIDVSYGALHSDDARRALESLSVFRPKPHAFSKEMAREICDAPPAMLFELSDMGLAEHFGHGDYTMHRVIAEYARKKLPKSEAARLHGKALDWYAAKLEDDIDRDPAAYLGWYRYEQTDWQATKDAWLYHLAASGDAIGSMLAFLRVYFDAFWWWGYYQRFPFCERLVREWLQRDLGTAQRKGLQQIVRFQECYPAGYDKRGREDDWRQVERSLVAVRQGLGLDGDAARISGEDARRVRSFTDFFLAECAAYGRGDRAEALKRYTAAHDQFLNDGNPWEAAWVWFYVGQYMLDRADRGGAREYVERSLAEAGEDAPLRERDPELLANDYRLLGDLHLAAGDLEAAARDYRRAAFYAFIFQAIPESADTYTVAFYHEIAGRITAKIASVYTTGRRRGRELIKAIRSYWEPWWAKHPTPGEADLDQVLKVLDPATLEAYMFPALPKPDELLERAGPFAEQVESVVERLRTSAAIKGEAEAKVAATPKVPE